MSSQSGQYTPEEKNKIIRFLQEKFLSVVRSMLNETKAISRVNQLKDQYSGLPNDALCEILIKRAKRKTTVEGASNGAAITGCQVSIPATGGSSTPVAAPVIAALILGDVTYTTKVQMQLIMDIAQLYECPFSKGNEEDVWFIFKSALGLKGTEKVGAYARVIFYETAKKQFRKLLRTGIRRAIQRQVTKIAGRKISRYVAEKYLLRLIPVLNTAIGGYFNNRVTKSVGKWTKVRAKIRASTFNQIDLLNNLKSTEKYWALPLIFAVGTLEDKLTDNVLSLYVQSRDRLKLTEDQTKLVEELANDEQLDNKMESAFSTIQNKDIKSSLLDVAVTTAAVNIKTTRPQEEYLGKIASWLGLEFEKKMLKDKVKYLKK